MNCCELWETYIKAVNSLNSLSIYLDCLKYTFHGMVNNASKVIHPIVCFLKLQVHPNLPKLL